MSPVEIAEGVGMTTKGDLLLGLVARGENGDTEYELLREFFAGYPIDRLSLLLTSELDSAAKAGAWIASELGDVVVPLLDDLVALLHHPYRDVRFFAADSVLLSADESRGDAIAEVVMLLDDPDKAVRWRVMKSLAYANREQLVVSVPHLGRTKLGGLLAEMLLEDVGVVEQWLNGTERERRCAAVAAGRLAVGGDPSLLQRVEANDCPEVSQFASDLLEHLAIARK